MKTLQIIAGTVAGDRWQTAAVSRIPIFILLILVFTLAYVAGV
jgi:hypothetical protein